MKDEVYIVMVDLKNGFYTPTVEAYRSREAAKKRYDYIVSEYNDLGYEDVSGGRGSPDELFGDEFADLELKGSNVVVRLTTLEVI